MAPVVSGPAIFSRDGQGEFCIFGGSQHLHPSTENRRRIGQKNDSTAGLGRCAPRRRGRRRGRRRLWRAGSPDRAATTASGPSGRRASRQAASSRRSPSRQASAGAGKVNVGDAVPHGGRSPGRGTAGPGSQETRDGFLAQRPGIAVGRVGMRACEGSFVARRLFGEERGENRPPRPRRNRARGS